LKYVADSDEARFDAAFDRQVADAIDAERPPEADVDLIEAGLDSFDFICLMMALEDEFGGFWPVERLSSFADLTTVGALRSAARDALWVPVR
jgi:acyl carrier protein